MGSSDRLNRCRLASAVGRWMRHLHDQIELHEVFNVLRRIAKSVSFRLKMAQFGVFFLRSKRLSIKSLRIAGKRIELSFPTGEEDVHAHELGKILFNDCYRLGQIEKPVKTVIDVGANIGLFSITARHFFPNAMILAYEPNTRLETQLKAHCLPLSVQ